MYTRFNTDTVVTRFIKSLLANTNIPLVKVWNPGDYCIEGLYYISKEHILKCNVSGQPKSVIDTTDEGERYFDLNGIYIPGEKYFNITSNYVSNTGAYDARTHMYLGNYLRYYRDYYGIDLMPFYNCFGNEYIDNVDFGYQLDEKNDKLKLKVFAGTDNRYKIASVPVKFGKVYSIAIDSDIGFEVILGFYGPKGLIDNPTNSEDGLLGRRPGVYTKVNYSQFSHPYLYTTPSYSDVASVLAKDTPQFEKYLRLLIKIPVESKSSVVVIEGDIHTDTRPEENQSNNVTFTNFSLSCNSKSVNGDFSPKEIFSVNRISKRRTLVVPVESCLSPLGLLQFSDGNVYAFSNRLVEYLLLSVISGEDEITKNVSRIQEYASSSTNANKNLVMKYSNPYTPGVWDDSLRSYLYGMMVTAKNTTGKPLVDINGYVDKDTEQIITRGQEV